MANLFEDLHSTENMHYESKQTFVNVPHDSSVVNGTRHHKVPISCPADVIYIFYVSPRCQL